MYKTTIKNLRTQLMSFKHDAECKKSDLALEFSPKLNRILITKIENKIYFNFLRISDLFLKIVFSKNTSNNDVLEISISKAGFIDVTQKTKYGDVNFQFHTVINK